MKHISKADALFSRPDGLPIGWFESSDVAFYRHIYSLVPDGGHTAEIGIYRGRSICSVADLILAKHLHVFCIDTFGPLLADHDEMGYERFLMTAEEYGIAKNITISKGDSLWAARGTANRSLDFAFIDADHSAQSVTADINAWLPKIRIGGWLGGHDYSPSDPGVKVAVHRASFDNLQIKPPSTIWLTQVREAKAVA